LIGKDERKYLLCNGTENPGDEKGRRRRREVPF
jgi:hypothetical protein